jgi:hypothetical protein
MSMRRKWSRGFLAIALVAIAAAAVDEPKEKGKDTTKLDENDQAILARLAEPVELHFNKAPLIDVLKFIKGATQGPNDSGIPIYVDPVGLLEAEQTTSSPASIDAEGVPLKTSLKRLLKPLGLTYRVASGLLTVTSESTEDDVSDAPKKEGVKPK